MFERIRAIIKQNIIIIILELNKLEPTSSIMPEGRPSGIILEVGSSLRSGCRTKGQSLIFLNSVILECHI